MDVFEQAVSTLAEAEVWAHRHDGTKFQIGAADQSTENELLYLFRGRGGIEKLTWGEPGAPLFTIENADLPHKLRIASPRHWYYFSLVIELGTAISGSASKRRFRVKALA